MARPAGSGEPTELLYGLHAVREALRAGTRSFVKLLLLHRERQFGEIARRAREVGVPVHVEPREALDRLVPGGRHQGVVGVVAAKAYDTADHLIRQVQSQPEPAMVVVLDGVEDPHNLGAILRSAEAAGVHGVFVPERRAAGLTGIVAKTSAGALEHVPVARVGNVGRLLDELKAQGLWVYGLDPSAPTPYTNVDFRQPVAVVLGGEGAGVRPGVLAHCDQRIGIPMRGRVASLNVSAAAAVVLFEIVRQRRGGGNQERRPSEA